MAITAQKLFLKDAEVVLYPALFESEKSDDLFTALHNHIAWKQDPITFFGKTFLQPRLTAYYGDKPYTYSKITMYPSPWIPPLVTIKSVVESLADVKFNGVLLNFYRDGSDYMGWHSDDEKELDLNSPIASVSFGATRRFLFRRKDNHQNKVEIDLNHGDCLIMRGTTQKFWQHQIPKTSKNSAHQVGARINLTFRTLK